MRIALGGVTSRLNHKHRMGCGSMRVDNLLSLWSDNVNNNSKPNILTTNARVLIMIMADSSMTQIAMSITLGVSETAIDKAVANLKNAGIISVERVGRRNRYLINDEALLKNRDILAIKEFIQHVQARVTNT